MNLVLQAGCDLQLLVVDPRFSRQILCFRFGTELVIGTSTLHHADRDGWDRDQTRRKQAPVTERAKLRAPKLAYLYERLVCPVDSIPARAARLSRACHTPRR